MRRRYAFRCGYCGVSETDAGGELTVDHYQPVSAGGDDTDDNLVYACWRCNLNKLDFWPADTGAAYRVLHPLRDNIALHLRENVLTGQLEPLTTTGRAHIALLQLNRAPLIANRLQRARAQLAAEVSDDLRRELEAERALNAALRHNLARMEQVQSERQSDDTR